MAELLMLAVAWLASTTSGRALVPVHVAGGAFSLGIILFSGTLYAFGLFAVVPVEGAAPVGGFLLIVGWLTLLWIAVRSRLRP